VKSTNRRCAQCRKKVDSSEALYGGLKAFCCYECLRQYIDSERGQKAVQSVKRKDIKERKEKLNMRKLKTLTTEYEFLSNKFRGSIPRCVRNRLSRLEDVINVKTAIYEEALKND